MKSQIRIFILAILLLLSFQFLSAENKRIGVFVGGNYFVKSERPGFKVYNNNLYGYGHYMVDESGFSAQAGIIVYISERWHIEATYRFPRFTSAVYAATFTPYVYGPNTYFTESMSTSWTAAAKFHMDKINIFNPYLGFGLDLARVEAFHSVGFIHPETYVIAYIFPEDHLGVKNVLGFFVPFGTTIDIFKNLKLDANINYTYMKLPEWSEDFPLASDQNLSGFYFNVNLVYNIW